MLLVTWNARKGQFTKKAPLLEPFGADITVIQEIAAPIERTKHILWFGDNKYQGVAVIANPSYKIEFLEQNPNAPKYVVPISVKGPRSFVLFAVWTLGKQEMRYIRAAATAIDMYRNIFASNDVVMMGDFNSNSIWDREHPPHLNHSGMVKKLEEYDMVSAYHHNRKLAHGLEPRSEHTFHLYGHEEKSYHIDYCFLPSHWANTIDSVNIGAYDYWCKHSDHRPLSISLGNEA